MNKKGFTLIELLAIIVILAIIALITTPIILNVIEESRQSAAKDSAHGVVEAVRQAYTESQITDSPISLPAIYKVADGHKINGGKVLVISGTKPTAGTVTIEKEGTVTITGLKINNYTCNKTATQNDITCTK